VSQFTESSPADQHRVASEQLVAIAEQVSDWDAPTPVREWVARDIPEHLTWLGGFLGGLGVSVDIPHHDDPAAQVRSGQVAGRGAVVPGDRRADVRRGGAGRRRARMGTPQPDADGAGDRLVLHRRTGPAAPQPRRRLARSQGLEVTFDEDWATGAFHGMSAMGPALHASGQFGTPQPVGEDGIALDPTGRLPQPRGRRTGTPVTTGSRSEQFGLTNARATTARTPRSTGGRWMPPRPTRGPSTSTATRRPPSRTPRSSRRTRGAARTPRSSSSPTPGCSSRAASSTS
jgi:hypothetical protein